MAMGIYDKTKKTAEEKATGTSAGGGGRARQRERDGDYDNAEATAVQLWRAAVSTEGHEA